MVFIFFYFDHTLIADEEEKEWSAVLELQRIKAEAAEAERIRKEQLNLSDNEEDTEKELLASRNSFIFTMRQRRAHFKRKLFALDRKIRDLNKVDRFLSRTLSEVFIAIFLNLVMLRRQLPLLLYFEFAFF